MKEEVIPKTVTIDFGLLPESMQRFHINTARNKGVSLEEQLIGFIHVSTQTEQDKISKATQAEIQHIENFAKGLGLNIDSGRVREYFDDEDDSGS